MPGAENQVSWNDFVFNDLLVVIDVVKKLVECSNALNETAFKVGPFASGNDPGNQIEREDAFDALILLAIDSESDALVEKRNVRVAATFVECLGRHFGKHFMESTVMGTWLT